MRIEGSTGLAVATLAAVLMTASARAQDAPEHFGGAEGTTTIPAASFVGLPAPDSTGFSNYEYPGHPGGGVVGTALFQLPNGVEITQLCLVAFDAVWNGDVGVILIGWEYPRAGITTPTAGRTLATATSGYWTMPGMGTFCAPLASPLKIKSFGDLDANGVSGWTAYQLRVTIAYGPMGGVTPQLSSQAFGSVILVWRRTVAPAPAAATFSDVPTSHPLFRFVEAMAGAGIAGPCTAGRFCPDAPVTRAEFAAFFALALGLHFPN